MSVDESAATDLDSAFEQLAGMSLLDNSMESVLQRVCDLARALLPGDVAASVSILADDRPGTVAFAGDLARRLDESQYGRGYGPCLEAIARRTPQEVGDTRSDPRWPDHLRVAVEAGCLSTLSVPLPIQEQQWGAGLNLYARQPRAFSGDPAGRAAVDRFAAYAAVAVANMHDYAAAVAQGRELSVVLRSRTSVGQAQGILMERHGVSADQAFQALVMVSMRTHVRVWDVAQQVVETGELAPPRGPRPPD